MDAFSNSMWLDVYGRCPIQKLLEHILAMTEPDARSWIFSMINSSSHVEFTKLAIALWAIWSSRRN